MFIDLCGGIGGGRIGLEEVKMECVGFAESDEEVARAYRAICGDDEVNYGDVTKIDPARLPEFELVLARLPDSDRCFKSIVEIIKEGKPYGFLIDNNGAFEDTEKAVKSLSDAGYFVISQTLNTKDYDCNIRSEDEYLIGVREDLPTDGMQEDWSGGIGPSSYKEFFRFENPVYRDSLEFKKLQMYLNNESNRDIDWEEFARDDYTVFDTRGETVSISAKSFPKFDEHIGRIYYSKDETLYKLSGKEALHCLGFGSKNVNKLTSEFNDRQLLRLAGNTSVPNIFWVLGEELLDFFLEGCELEVTTT